MSLGYADNMSLASIAKSLVKIAAAAEKLAFGVPAEKEKAAPARERLCYSDMCRYEVGGRWDCEWFPNTRHVVIPVT